MKPYYSEDGVSIFHGDCREILPALPGPDLNCCVTSPPYFGLRYYGESGIGMEDSLATYQQNLLFALQLVGGALAEDATLWLNLGDCYANDGKWGGETGGKQAYLDDANRQRVGREKRVTGLPGKNLVGVPWRIALGLQELGWILRLDIIWHKPNVLPESVKDRPTKEHEYIFLLSKSQSYYYNQDATLEPCSPNTHKRLAQNIERQIGSERANKRSVWTVPIGEGEGDHTATFPVELITPCILAGCPPGGTVLDPFCGTGTTLLVAKENGCRAIGIEIEEKYCEIAAKRLAQKVLNFPAAARSSQ